MELHRTKQKNILEILAACYPDHSLEVVSKDSEKEDCANLYYLQEHGLITASLKRSLSGAYFFSGASITAKGLDFLADDGGLSAILGTVTIKIHSDSIKDILQTHISVSNLPEDQQSWLQEKVDTLSEETLKTVTKSLVGKGLDKIPDLYEWAKLIF